MSPVERRGPPGPYAFQHLLEHAKWGADAVRDDVLEYARKALGEGGILAVDEMGFLRKGGKSLGRMSWGGVAGGVITKPSPWPAATACTALSSI